MKYLKISTLLALILATTSFTGCGGSSSSPAVGTSGTITFTSPNSATVGAGSMTALDVDATDPGGNAVTYTLSGADAAKFSIDGNGIISFNAPATAGTYTVTVTATAGGKSASQNITITVTAPANHAPVITSAATTTVNENQTAAIDVDATDADGDTITYSLEGGADAAEMNIDPTNGVITFKTAPDYEAKASYAFTVGAYDGVTTTTQDITITIADVAEGSAPVITTPGTVSVNENQKGAVDIDATDSDGDAITYSLEGGVDDASFDINATTGIVTFKTEPDYETKNSYSIIAGASDGTSTTTKNIVISIIDLKGGSKVPKTGQTVSYTTHDDGAYQEWMARSFTKGGILKHIGPPINITIDTRFVKDDTTKLEWIDNSHIVAKNYTDAASYCNALNYNTKTDWRLPSVNELYTIADRGTDNPAIFGDFDNTRTDKRYWSSTKYKRMPNRHYTVGFDKGNDYAALDTADRYVRCVRKDFSFLIPWLVRFTRANNVITDNRTQLQWWDPTTMIFVPATIMPYTPAHIEFVGAAASTGTFEEAINGCESLNAGGKGDWRLPNINELLTIVDQSKSTGVAFFDEFKSNTGGLYFSSTTRADDTSKAWVVNFTNGQDVIGTAKTSVQKYRCVRTMGD